MEHCKNNRGMSLAYIVIAIAVLGIIMTTLMQTGSQNEIKDIYYSNAQSARNSVNTGFNRALAFLESEDTAAVLEVLQTWIDSTDPATIPDSLRWLCGGESAWDTLTGSNIFRTEILGFDQAAHTIYLRSEGIGRNQAKASAVGLYRLDGLDIASNKEWGNEHAVFMEDGVTLDLKDPIHIKGASRFSAGVNFDEQTSGSIFDGPFSTQASSSEIMLFKGIYSFNGNALFQTKPDLQKRITGSSSFSFNAKAGFTKGAILKGDAKFQFTHDTATSFWLSNPEKANWSGENYYFNDHKIYHSTSTFPDQSWIHDVSDKEYRAGLTLAEIQDSLQIPDPCPYDVNLGVIPEHYIIDFNEIGASATKFRDYAQNHPKWNDFTVLRLKQTVSIGDDGTSINANKFIVIVEKNGKIQPSAAGKMFSVKGNGHFTIVNNGGSVSNIGGWDAFRGLLYRKTGTFHVGGNTIEVDNFKGAIYVQNDDKPIEWYPQYPSSNATISYDPTVLEELHVQGQDDGTGNTWLLTDCSSDPDDNKIKITITQDHITSKVLSRSF